MEQAGPFLWGTLACKHSYSSAPSQAQLFCATMFAEPASLQRSTQGIAGPPEPSSSDDHTARNIVETWIDQLNPLPSEHFQPFQARQRRCSLAITPISLISSSSRKRRRSLSFDLTPRVELTSEDWQRVSQFGENMPDRVYSDFAVSFKPLSTLPHINTRLLASPADAPLKPIADQPFIKGTHRKRSCVDLGISYIPWNESRRPRIQSTGKFLQEAYEHH